ncbi:MAG: hypothetical protein Phog2KO_29610 [Phototrophicaceae bacterium]
MPRQIEHFTASGRKVIRLARNIAIRAQHSELSVDHIMLAMTHAKDTNAYHALQDVDIIDSKLAPYLSILHPPTKDHPLRFDGLRFGDEIQDLFRLSFLDATLRGHDYIASAHLLIGLMRLNSQTITAILEHFSLERKELIKATEYYFDKSVEAEKHRIPISVASEENLGCLPMLQTILLELSRKRKNDE